MVSQLDSLSEQTSSSQIEAAKATAGDTAKSDGTTSASIPAPQSATAEGARQEGPSSSAVAPSDSLLPLNDSVSLSSSTTIESASVFDVISSSESAAHPRVFS